MADIDWNTKDFDRKSKELAQKIEDASQKGVLDVAVEVLRLSQREVPHDKGTLQDSGHLEPEAPATEITVGYNTVYAARLHEHPEYHFQAGRKGKYLEDPIKMNLTVFREYMIKALNDVIF